MQNCTIFELKSVASEETEIEAGERYLTCARVHATSRFASPSIKGWILSDPGTEHFCSHGTVLFMNIRPHGTSLLWCRTESK